MAVMDQVLTDRYAIYNGDCVDILRSMRDKSVHMSVYSPPFGTPTGGLFVYSSSDRDISNSPTYELFMKHYEFVVQDIARVTMPGRISAVHCMDVPSGNSGRDHLIDFPGDIIRMHTRLGFDYIGRHAVWKEPLAVRNRTMAKNLAHRSLVEDSSLCSMASADWLLMFRRHGDNPIPITHPTGLMDYAGSRLPPTDILKYRGWTGNQIENRYSHWIWRQYASAFWDDVRIDRVLPFKEARDENDEKHVHPLQLDVIERAVILRSNPGEVVLTPFMGVGSEAYGALMLGRKAIGVELKPSYFRQAVKNVRVAIEGGFHIDGQIGLGLDDATEADPWPEMEIA